MSKSVAVRMGTVIRLEWGVLPRSKGGIVVQAQVLLSRDVCESFLSGYLLLQVGFT